MKAVWICFDFNRDVADENHAKVFASIEAAEAWLEQNDPGGLAFEYEVRNTPGDADRPRSAAEIVSQIAQAG
ncbi:hypothetical protein ACFFWD_11535 [Bradyrhizobium erythrophlei]|uniref:hypothetical protein n=1 Tax=Bradyrhizobium erythrophlei TaxID=1437360 RepID=UPI0035E91E20